MDVRFLRGLASAYAAIATKDSKTFYFTTDDNKLYLGDVCLSNQDVEARIKVIEDHGYVNGGEVDAKISTAIANYYTKGEVDTLIAGLSVGAIEGRIKAIEDDYLKKADKEALQAEIDADVKVVSDYIADNEAKWSEKYDDTALEARVTAVEGVADAAQTAQEVSDAIDAKITALDLANTYDVKGAAATAEQNAKDYADQALVDFENAWIKADENGTVDKLNEIAAWLNTEGAGAQKIIADVATNTANIATNAGDIDKVEAKLNGIAEGDGTVKAAIDAVDAKFADYTKTADLGDLATKDSLTAGEVGAYTKEETNSAISTATTDMATNASVDAKLESYAKTADISADIAKGVEAQGWGNHAEQGYLKAADIEGKEDKANLKALAYKDIAEKSDLAADVQASLGKADTALQTHQDISHLATKAVVGDGFDGKTVTQVVSENAQACQNNFNTISEQLTWSSF